MQFGLYPWPASCQCIILTPFKSCHRISSLQSVDTEQNNSDIQLLLYRSYWDFDRRGIFTGKEGGNI